jgi:hypothetical protein
MLNAVCAADDLPDRFRDMQNGRFRLERELSDAFDAAKTSVKDAQHKSPEEVYTRRKDAADAVNQALERLLEDASAALPAI